MAFDMYTQPQGVNIPISIWGDAMAQGTAIGSKVPSTLGAIAQGLTQGINNAQAVYQTQQQIAATALDIQAKEQSLQLQPLRQQQLEQQIQIQNNQLKEDAMKQEQAVATQAQAIEAKKAQLTEITASNTEATKNRTEADNFWSKFSNADPQTQKEMTLSGEYAGFFANNPKAYQAAWGSLRQELLNDDERRQGQYYGAKLNLDKEYRTNVPKYREAESKNRAAVQGDGDFTSLAADMNLSPNLAMDRIELVDNGSLKIDPTTGTRIRGDKGTFVPAEGYDPTKVSSTLDAFDKETGKLIRAGVPRALKTKFDNWRASSSLADGTYLNQETDSLKKILAYPDASKSAVTPASPTQEVPIQQVVTSNFAPSKEEDIAKQKATKLNDGVKVAPRIADRMAEVPIGTKEGTTNITNDKSINGKPTAYDIAQKTLGIPKEKFSEIKPSITKLYRLLEEEPKGWFGPYDPEQQEVHDETTKSIIDYMGELEFKTASNSANLYNERSVRAHNKIASEFAGYMRGEQGIDEVRMKFLIAQHGIETMVMVSTPQELCTLLNARKFGDALHTLEANASVSIKGHKKSSLMRNDTLSVYTGDQNG